MASYIAVKSLPEGKREALGVFRSSFEARLWLIKSGWRKVENNLYGKEGEHAHVITTDEFYNTGEHARVKG